MNVLRRGLDRLVQVRPDEVRALAWSFAYFFCLLAAYYVLRPLRDEMGIAGGVRNLHWLFSATFVVMLAAVPLFGAVVARLPRRRFIPLVYHFFVANIVIFWILLVFDVSRVHVARVFFVWISVFNLFAVSVFWSFMADVFASEQGKRLFGFIAAGGSAGALCGPALTVGLAGPLGAVNLLLVAVLLLEAAIFCAWRLESAAPERTDREQRTSATQEPIGGGALAGFALLARTPYLAGIALWVFLLSLAGTFLYFQQANIVAAASDDPAVRTRIFASIDLAAGVLTVLVQVLLTGRVMKRFGVGTAAALLPFVFTVGFVALALHPVLSLVIALQALQRTANFAVSNPAREVLFTVLGREEKYKAKYVIDGVVFRGADAANGWLFNALRAAGLELAAIALTAVPICVLWIFVARMLGLAHDRRAARAEEGTSPH
ncbi:MAG TPA: MFS transporter [Burkholderiales bacterium]|nr:MFS transporter [Burkholderiales bacterium]